MGEKIRNQSRHGRRSHALRRPPDEEARPGWGHAQGIPVNPIHQAVLNWMGVGIVENLDLERAVETARRLNRYEFMLTFAPLPVEGGTGSPLNPLAVF